MKSIDAKREQEKRVVSQMVHLYCRKQHHRPDLCPTAGKFWPTL